MSLSIRWRLTLWIATALILTITAIFLTLRFTLYGILSGDLDDDLSRDLGQVAAQVTIAGSLEEADLQRIVAPASFIVAIRDPEGNMLAASPGVDSQRLALTEEELARVLEGDAFSRTLEITGEETRVRTARLTIGRRVVGIVQVGESAETINEVIDVLQIILIGEGIGAAVLSLALGYWLARSALKPIGDVTRVAREIEASDLSRRIGVRGKPQEVQRLADTFDGMLKRLDAAFQQQRDFVLDVSHELRTPLTALRGNLDVLLMDGRLEGELRTQLERMSREVARLIRLTSNLLYLAHADVGRELDHRPVELDTLCLEVYRQTKDLRPEVRFRLGHEDQVTMVGDRDLLKQLVLNLVDNSLKYTPADGEVTLSLYGDQSRARIVVSDTGPGISPDQVTLIFRRFYRAEGGEKGTGGAGIGLAISDWIARAHGGEITVESEVGKGSTFTVSLPLDSAAGQASAEEPPEKPMS
jgi:signal transduction histidine kinase